MNKLELAIKVIGVVVITLIVAGIFNQTLLTKIFPVIVGGIAVMLVLYVINAFKTKNTAKVFTILLMAAFVAMIMWYRR